MSSLPIWFTNRSNWPKVGGASTGCKVMRTCSRTISLGGRSTHGVSVRVPRQVLSKRHRKGGSQVKPDSISTTIRRGNFWNTPSATRLSNCAWNACACAT